MEDGNGKITSTELAEVLRSAGQNPTDEQLKQMIDEADTNK